VHTVDELQNSHEWAPVKHDGGYLKPPLGSEQPCGQTVLYIRRQPVVANDTFSVVDLCHPNGEPVQKGEVLRCPTCPVDVMPDIQRVVAEILFPYTAHV
jgi:hypothetical protein